MGLSYRIDRIVGVLRHKVKCIDKYPDESSRYHDYDDKQGHEMTALVFLLCGWRAQELTGQVVFSDLTISISVRLEPF